MPVHTLTELQYSQNRKGPWVLYIFEPDSEYHSAGIWFCTARDYYFCRVDPIKCSGKPKYPDEEEGVISVKVKCAAAMRAGREVRICDTGDNLVFHAKGARVLFGENFWREITQEVKQ